MPSLWHACVTVGLLAGGRLLFFHPLSLASIAPGYKLLCCWSMLPVGYLVSVGPIDTTIFDKNKMHQKSAIWECRYNFGMCQNIIFYAGAEYRSFTGRTCFMFSFHTLYKLIGILQAYQPLTVTPVTVTFRQQWQFFGPKKDLFILKIPVTVTFRLQWHFLALPALSQ